MKGEGITYLVAIIELKKVDRVFCQSANCHHTVFRRVHIVLQEKAFRLLGSSCFNREYGHMPIENRTPQFGGVGGVPMTQESRDLLLRNTAEFVAYLQALEIEKSKLTRLKPRSTPCDIQVQSNAQGVVTPQAGRDLLAYMWKTKTRGGPPADALTAQHDAFSRLALRYYATGRFGDPWALAQLMLGRHGISHLETQAVLCRLDLMELLPAYAMVREVPNRHDCQISGSRTKSRQ